MEESISVEGLYTVADALAEVKRRHPGKAVTYYAVVSNDVPIVDDNKEKTGQCFPGALYAHIALSKAQALKLVEDFASTLKGLEVRGGRIPLKVRHTDWGAAYAKRYRVSVYIG
jgi:hypothetical protein